MKIKRLLAILLAVALFVVVGCEPNEDKPEKTTNTPSEKPSVVSTDAGTDAENNSDVDESDETEDKDPADNQDDEGKDGEETDANTSATADDRSKDGFVYKDSPEELSEYYLKALEARDGERVLLLSQQKPNDEDVMFWEQLGVTITDIGEIEMKGEHIALQRVTMNVVAEAGELRSFQKGENHRMIKMKKTDKGWTVISNHPTEG